MGSLFYGLPFVAASMDCKRRAPGRLLAWQGGGRPPPARPPFRPGSRPSSAHLDELLVKGSARVVLEGGRPRRRRRPGRTLFVIAPPLGRGALHRLQAAGLPLGAVVLHGRRCRGLQGPRPIGRVDAETVAGCALWDRRCAAPGHESHTHTCIHTPGAPWVR